MENVPYVEERYKHINRKSYQIIDKNSNGKLYNMVTKEECKCINSITEGIIDSIILKDVVPKHKPDYVKDIAIKLKEDIDNIGQFCKSSPRADNLFMPGEYREAKNNLNKVIYSNGEDKESARKAGACMSTFLLINTTRMIKCPKIKH